MDKPHGRIAIFASGTGTNAEAIMHYFRNHHAIQVAVLMSNRADAYALERARKNHIPTRVFNRKQLYETGEVLNWLAEYRVTHVVLAGFLWLIPESLIRAYPERIINIHPALLPKYGGKGMYGMRVHQAVKAANDKETGITIHLVNERYDEGKILLQARVALSGNETPEEIAEKVHELEYRHYPSVIEKWVQHN